MGERKRAANTNSHTPSTKCQYSANTSGVTWCSGVTLPVHTFTCTVALMSRPTNTWIACRPRITQNNDA